MNNFLSIDLSPKWSCCLICTSCKWNIVHNLAIKLLAYFSLFLVINSLNNSTSVTLLQHVIEI